MPRDLADARARPRDSAGGTRRPPAASAWRTWTVRVLSAALAGFAVRTTYLAAGWLVRVPGATRFQVETSATWLVAVAVLIAAFRRPSAASPARPEQPLPAWTCLLWCGGSVLLYYPALSIGLLSDDFVLTRLARHGSFGAFNAEAFRPVPLLIWSAVLHGGGGAPTLHLLNLVIHGLVAFLVTRLAAPFAGRRWSVAAGLVVLTFPLAPEAVAWCSGVFDVGATCAILGVVLAARRYGPNPVARDRVTVFALAVIALLCKETAAVAPALILLDAFARRAIRRPLLVDAGVMAGAMAAVGGVRLAFAPASLRTPLTKYVVQRWLFGTVASLAVPAHADVVTRWPALPIVGVVVLVTLVSAFPVWGSVTRTRRAGAAFALFALAGTLPAITIFFVAPDLQQSRYVYLASTGYAVLAALVSASVGSARRPAAALVATAVAALLAVNGVMMHMQLTPWLQAAATRDRVVLAFASDPRVRACADVVVSKLPDNIRGAYVFRNGAPVALAAGHARVDVSTGAGPCAFSWNEAESAFVASEDLESRQR